LESIIAKYLGTVVAKRLNPRQHGNRKNYSSLSQLICAHEELLLKTQIHGRVDCIRIDFTRAADMVVHSILIEKLRELCIDPSIVRWIRAFLTGRLQVTKVCNTVSEPLQVTSGLPQGSPISNVLLNIYLNDLYKLMSRYGGDEVYFDIYQYSDDSLISKRITCKQDCYQLQSVLDAVGDWTEEHGMQINVKKCHFLTFTLPNQTHCDLNFSYQLLGQNIEQVQNMKYLGVIVSNDFSCIDQFQYVMNNEKTLASLRICQNLHEYPLAQESYYKQYLLTRLEDSCAAWNLPFIAKNRDEIMKLENFQDNAVSSKVSNGFEYLAKRRLMHSFITLSKIVNRDPSYLDIVKRVDVFSEDFRICIFQYVMESEHSIIGNAIVLLALFKIYLRQQEDSQSVSVMSEILDFRFNSHLNNFCSMYSTQFLFPNNCGTQLTQFNQKVSTTNALLVINQCLHPNMSYSRIEQKIELVNNSRVSNTIPLGMIRAVYMHD
jgi:Reverse transcriptase (RNA-dependent DNA polymerase)